MSPNPSRSGPMFTHRQPSPILPAAAAALTFVLTGCEPPAPVVPPPTPMPSATPAAPAFPTPRPSPTPTPLPVIESKRIETTRLYSGLRVQSEVLATRSEETASSDRQRPGSYQLELTLKVDVPAPSRTLEQIARNDPTLPTALAGLAERLPTARVSPAFEQIYALKLDYLKSRLSRLDALLSPHNFYDTETILEFENPATGARALFLQGDMDVNTDGSDGDRNFTVDGSSMFFQPQTSYRWRRLTNRANPFTPVFQKRLADAKAELAKPGVTAARKTELQEIIRHAEATLYELRTFSFLLAGADPYIVLPIFMVRGQEGPFKPSIGDFAVVVYNGVTYPAILGDAGPSYKMGEGSLRLAQQMNPRSSAISRPVSSLKATYLVFPGSKDEKALPPDLDRWHARCAELLAGVGLTPANLHRWENVVPPWPTPTPAPTPTPSASPSPAAAGAASPSPSPTAPGTPPPTATPASP